MVMRRAVDLSPVLVMGALLMGSELLGIVGAILALPVAASISVFVSELLHLRDQQLAEETGESKG
jgi:predicted PurR-regulated permease PerM